MKFPFIFKKLKIMTREFNLKVRINTSCDGNGNPDPLYKDLHENISLLCEGYNLMEYGTSANGTVQIGESNVSGHLDKKAIQNLIEKLSAKL